MKVLFISVVVVGRVVVKVVRVRMVVRVLWRRDMECWVKVGVS